MEKQIWIGILNQLNSDDIPSNISILYTNKDIRMSYDSSFVDVKKILCEKIQAIIDSMPDEPIQ